MTGFVICWVNDAGARMRSEGSFSHDAAKVLVNGLNEGVRPGFLCVPEQKATDWMSFGWTPQDRCFVAWTTPDGQRDAALRTLSEDRALHIVNRLNTYLHDMAEYAVVPERFIDAWKDCTWTP